MKEENNDKPFEASEQKLRRARQDGDIPRSNEVNAATMYIGVWLVFAVGAGFMVQQWLTMASRVMGAEPWPEVSWALAKAVGKHASIAVALLMLVPVAVILTALIAQRGLVFSAKKLAFDPKRLNPVKNAAQKFGPSGLMTFAISLAKAAFVCFGGWFLFSTLLDRLGSAALGGGRQWVEGLPLLLQQVLLMAVAISVVFAVIDSLWKRHEYLKRHRMSRKEMEDEHKEAEGDPHLKAARRQKAVDIAMKQMLADVAKADVIIVNPTHYAVALEWKRGSGRAPVCLAKGTDDVAARIRARAKDHEVPIFSDPPCARAIHATVKIGEEIQRQHFAAVAVALRFATQMREKARAGW